MKFPENAPSVTFELPDDWTVTPADGGLQLVSPDRTSIILAGMTKADKAGLTEWQRAAARRMVDFGIAFDSKANAPKAPRPGAEDGPIAPLADPAAQPKVKAGELAPLSSVPSMALLGKASDLSVAELEAGEETGRAGASGTEAKPESAKNEPAKNESTKNGAEKAAAGKSDKPGNAKAAESKAAESKAAADKAAADRASKPLHFASVVIRGASLAGKPVDVQFLNFGYSKERWFLMQQESSPDDDRAGVIIKSVRAIR